jgi:hypothetical protein
MLKFKTLVRQLLVRPPHRRRDPTMLFTSHEWADLPPYHPRKERD